MQHFEEQLRFKHSTSLVLTPHQWTEWLKVPFERAAATGERGVVQKLVKAGAEAGGALHIAAEGSHKAIVSDLLGNGASVAAIGKGVDYGETPLHVGAEVGNTEMVQLLLLKGADINTLNYLRHSALYYAVGRRHVAAVLALLAVGADVSLRYDDLKRSIVHEALDNWGVDILRAVIEHGADVHTADASGRTE